MRKLLGTLALGLILVAGLPARSENLSPVLDRIRENVKRVSATGRVPIVVFDVDGTIFDNRYRTRAIIQDYVQSSDYRNSQEADSIMAITVNDIDYYLVDTLRKKGVNDVFLLEGCLRFWAERFFSNDYVRADLPLPGAVSFIREVHSAGALVVYLTGRDAPSMLEGTVARMKDVGFPIGLDRTMLIMKPVPKEPAYMYKRQARATLDKMGAVVAVFDNEPAHAVEVKEQWPNAEIVLIESGHATKVANPVERVSYMETYE